MRSLRPARYTAGGAHAVVPIGLEFKDLRTRNTDVPLLPIAMWVAAVMTSGILALNYAVQVQDADDDFKACTGAAGKDLLIHLLEDDGIFSQHALASWFGVGTLVLSLWCSVRATTLLGDGMLHTVWLRIQAVVELALTLTLGALVFSVRSNASTVYGTGEAFIRGGCEATGDKSTALKDRLDPAQVYVALALFGAALVAAHVVGFGDERKTRKEFDMRLVAGWAALMLAASICGVVYYGKVHDLDTTLALTGTDTCTATDGVAARASLEAYVTDGLMSQAGLAMSSFVLGFVLAIHGLVRGSDIDALDTSLSLGMDRTVTYRELMTALQRILEIFFAATLSALMFSVRTNDDTAVGAGEAFTRAGCPGTLVDDDTAIYVGFILFMAALALEDFFGLYKRADDEVL